MNTILIAIAALSLAAAAVLGVLLARTMRLERRRSAARVELLEQMAVARPAPVLHDLELRPGSRPAPADQASFAGIFHEHEPPSAWPRRLAIVGAMSAIVLAAFVGLRAMGSTPSAGEEPRQQQTARTTQPLELMSLQHAQQDGTLVITGLVQNPRNSASLANVQATAVLFGSDGATLRSIRAPIDFTTLGPGEESTFVIPIPPTLAVSRYRVGFRASDDTILNHVDRRNTETVARKEAP